MEGLRKCIQEAKKELAKKIQISPGQQEEMPMEIAEMIELEKKLRELIQKSEKILKQ